MDYFDEKATQIKPETLSSFGISIYSRYGNSDEIIEMIKFTRMLALGKINKYIDEVFYDSKSCICSIKYNKDSIPREIEERVHEAAKKTLTQFIWNDLIDQKDEN